MTQRRKRPRRIDPEVREEIERLTGQLSGPQISRKLELDERFADLVPSLRTIQSVMREASIPDIRTQADVWSLATAAPGEAEHVLPVLGCVMDRTAGKVTELRRDHAAWIARLRGALPHLDAWYIYLQAGQYAKAIEQGIPSNTIDLRLAREAWLPSAHKEEAQGEAFARGEVDHLSWTRAAARGMARVPLSEVPEQTRPLVRQALEELEEDSNG
jgi:hypothetical protein